MLGLGSCYFSKKRPNYRFELSSEIDKQHGNDIQVQILKTPVDNILCCKCKLHTRMSIVVSPVREADPSTTDTGLLEGIDTELDVMAVTPQTPKCHHNRGTAEVVVTFGSLWCHSHSRKRGTIFYSIMVPQN